MGAGGTLTFDFTSGRTNTRVATAPGQAGSFAEQFLGTLSADTTSTFTLGISADFSESCSQASPGAVINCSDTVSIPSAVTFTPEPTSRPSRRWAGRARSLPGAAPQSRLAQTNKILLKRRPRAPFFYDRARPQDASLL